MISLSLYSELLRRPDIKATFFASVIGRLPIGITGLSILLLVQAASGSFVSGGAAVAAYVAGLASVAPVLGRLIDRSGPRGILRLCAFVFPSALITLALSVHLEAHAFLTLTIAFAAGAAFPPISVCMRTFLRQRLGHDPLLPTAYSVESVLIESIFIAGPLLVALFVAFASASAAVFFSAASSLTGTLLFLRSPALRRWHTEPRARANFFGPLSEAGFIPLLAVVMCYSLAFGLVEIGVTAFTVEAGRPAFAGVILGLMSGGSAAGGLAYGSRVWRAPLLRQFALTLGLLGGGVALLALISDLWIFALLSVFAGIVMAPALTIQSMLVAKSASGHYAAEAFTWSATGLLSGISLGMALGGWLIELWSSAATFAAAALAAFSASGLAFSLRLRGDAG